MEENSDSWLEEPGHLVVLTNESLPALIRTGTSHTSAEKLAQELSVSATVSSPFQVAYSAYLGNCRAAIEFLNHELAQRGYRVTESFFRCPLQEVIEIIEESFAVSEPQQTQQLESTLLGEKYFHIAQNYRKTATTEGEAQYFNYMSKSAKQSYPLSYYPLALAFKYGIGTNPSPNSSIQWLQKAIEAGSLWAHTDAFDLYLQFGDREKATETLDHFLYLYEGYKETLEFDDASLARFLVRFAIDSFVNERNLSILLDCRDYFFSFRTEIKLALDHEISSSREHHPDLEQLYEEVGEAIDKFLG